MTFGNAYNVYKSNSVNYASKEQLLLMLLDGAVKFSKLARVAIEENNINEAHNNIVKTENIFLELTYSLDTNLGGKWAEDLKRVYEFIVDNLGRANISKDAKTLDDTISLICDVRDTWNEAYKLSKVDNK
ncbi:flagellar protein FliS [Hathewaya proteolytica DSM 3090]|uniref:Flagellar secretion chaperone FliS n=1 Tax=Hathewaya proteolytica DSM 3090 TaxID=1121331 RepID=A0A1M6LBC8_9CLOT|nr:flagellar export chaperone FliS [Hathewaya proteolytica]SHJ68527.1 flagellar protein FliS [Hathewaya proteolytica DSM 3090]